MILLTSIVFHPIPRIEVLTELESLHDSPVAPAADEEIIPRGDGVRSQHRNASFHLDEMNIAVREGGKNDDPKARRFPPLAQCALDEQKTFSVLLRLPDDLLGILRIPMHDV